MTRPLDADAGTPLVGVLALQGDVSEHQAALERCGASSLAVRTLEQLRAVDGLIIPGGESTTVGKLLVRFDLLEPLRERIAAGFPLWGTCTGMILLAGQVDDGLEGQPLLSAMDIRVQRNAFGRQRDSFQADVALRGIEGGPFPGVFIRAPLVASTGPGVDVLGVLGERVVAVRQGNLLATAFHPELTHDDRFHAYLVRMCRAGGNGRNPAAGNGRNPASGNGRKPVGAAREALT